jgi:hypothetical protein
MGIWSYDFLGKNFYGWIVHSRNLAVKNDVGVIIGMEIWWEKFLDMDI